MKTSKNIMPSLLAADFSNLKSDLDKLTKTDIEEIHYDVMDGHFVDNISFGKSILSQIHDKYDFKYDVHLMVSNPIMHIEKYFDLSKVNAVTWHHEAFNYKEQYNLINSLRGTNLKSNGKLKKGKQSKKDKLKNIDKPEEIKLGIAIKPKTNPEQVYEFFPYVDIILVMSVEPGKGGQKFIESSIKKIEKLNEARKRLNPNVQIYVDGGVNNETAKLCFQAGADKVVAGSYIFKSKDYKKQINNLFN